MKYDEKKVRAELDLIVRAIEVYHQDSSASQMEVDRIYYWIISFFKQKLYETDAPRDLYVFEIFCELNKIFIIDTNDFVEDTNGVLDFDSLAENLSILSNYHVSPNHEFSNAFHEALSCFKIFNHIIVEKIDNPKLGPVKESYHLTLRLSELAKEKGV